MHPDGIGAMLNLLADLPPLGPWVADAACRGRADTFADVPPTKKALPAVVKVCNGCPVRVECAAFAEDHQVHGIYAGRWRDHRGTARRNLPAAA